jgi:hypothetical protein
VVPQATEERGGRAAQRHDDGFWGAS